MLTKNQGISKILLIGGSAIALILITVVIIVVLINTPKKDTPQCLSEGTTATESDTCCNDLTKISCEGISTCSNCGNGICESHENDCSCPIDCQTDTSSLELTVEEHATVGENIDTPDNIGFKEHIAPNIFAKREDWRTPAILSSNTSTSENVDPYIDRTNKELQPLNYQFRRNNAPTAPITNRAFYDLYSYNNKIFSDLSFIRKFQKMDEDGMFTFAAEQALDTGIIRDVTYYDGELLVWDEKHAIDSIIYDGKLLEVIEETLENGTMQYTIKNEDATLYSFTPKQQVFTSRNILSFLNWENHWIVEYRDDSENNIVISDGISVAKDKEYDQVFNYTLIKGQPFFFFEKDGQFFMNYNGQEYKETYDLIIHNNCCEPAAFNPMSNENMIYFYALKRGVWYYVEAGIFE